MRAVWSFWSKPFYAYKGDIWHSPLHHLLAWGLSLRLARRQFPETVLVTDKRGKSLLVEHLGLHFTHISTELESIRNADIGWWALGKLVAYSLQDQPFVHLDTDVFLWKPLPPGFLNAPLFAQCPERHPPLLESWGPGDIEQAFTRHGLTLPVEWEWSRSRSTADFREENCGILGGTRTDFIRYYATLALELVLNPAHATVWSTFPETAGYNMIIEQFLLAACLDFHESHPESRFHGIYIRHLFSSFGESFDPMAAARAGFTHLLGGAKSHPAVGKRLEDRVKREDPAYFHRCQQVLAAVS